MQSITTSYTAAASGQGKVKVNTWYGVRRVLWDDALNSEQNHRAAVQSVLNDINAERGTRFAIVSSACAPGEKGGWVFIIDQPAEVAPLHMSILVRFMPSTNSGPAYMKTHSWLFDKGQRVNYSPAVADGSDIQANARYAAERELERINESVREHGDLIGYALDQYVQLPDGDRLFTLKSGNK